MSAINDIINKHTQDSESFQAIISAVNAIKKTELTFEHLVNISVVRNYTVDGIEPFICYHLYKSSINTNVKFEDYGVVTQHFLNPNSNLLQSKPEVILLSLLIENFALDFNSLQFNFDDCSNRLSELLSLIKSTTNALVILNTFLLPYHSAKGITNSNLLVDHAEKVMLLNLQIKKFARENAAQFFVVDFNLLAAKLGEEKTIDYRYLYMAKAPFKKDFLNAYAFEISKIIKAKKGKAKKCIVLDCDNTLWGGIVGEDGIDGIKLDNDSYPGKAFYDFQQNILNLYSRGVIITLCSKNNEADVFEVLEKHPHCLIKKHHLANWRVNWNDKASNIANMISEINIGLDSVVFVDDNPAECALVTATLPDVTTLQVPINSLFTYPNILLNNGYFDTLTLSDEDLQRTQMYQAETHRKEAQNTFTNLDEYLTSLEIVVNISNIKTSQIARVAQLTQKTNQFNLTTKRYTENDISNFVANENAAIFSLSVKDKFGDMGLAGVLIATKENEIASIDSLLLSCRILGRNIEIAFVQHCLVLLTKKWDIKTWKGNFVATKKNMQVNNFLEKFGFETLLETDSNKDYSCLSNNIKTQELKYITIQIDE